MKPAAKDIGMMHELIVMHIETKYIKERTIHINLIKFNEAEVAKKISNNTKEKIVSLINQVLEAIS